MLELKEIYNTITTDLRSLRVNIWKAQQIFITIVLAIIVIVHRISRDNLNQNLSLVLILIGATMVIFFIDQRYQNKKVKLRKQLSELENFLKVDSKWQLGNKDEKTSHFYLIYLILLFAGFAALLIPYILPFDSG